MTTTSLSQWASHHTASSRLKPAQIKHTTVRKENLQRPTEAPSSCWSRSHRITTYRFVVRLVNPEAAERPHRWTAGSFSGHRVRLDWTPGNCRSWMTRGEELIKRQAQTDHQDFSGTLRPDRHRSASNSTDRKQLSSVSYRVFIQSFIYFFVQLLLLSSSSEKPPQRPNLSATDQLCLYSPDSRADEIPPPPLPPPPPPVL